MRSGLVVPLNLMIGPAYDAIGRKIPTILLFILTTSGEYLVPFITSFSPGFVIVSILQVPNTLLGLIPFVPDLIQESSHGVANMINLFLNNFAALIGS